jgi:uncharacterized membrane protein (DUF485 family)
MADVDWEAIEASEPFRELERRRRRFTAVGLGVFFGAFGVFLVLCGYARGFMRESVAGGLSVAFVWVLALTVLAWILVGLYLRESERVWAPLAERVAQQARGEEPPR